MHDLRLDVEPLLRVARRSGIPAVGTAGVAELRGGYPTMTPDGDWLVDQAAGLPGYFVIGGDNVGGRSTAPALGADLAQWIGAGGRRPIRRAGPLMGHGASRR